MVLEIVAGIVIGPAVLGWVEIDEPVEVLALIGLAFLLFLAGLEIDFARAARPRSCALAAAGFAVSFALALVAGFALKAAGSGRRAAAASRSSSRRPRSGVIVPVLKDAGEIGIDRSASS